MAVMAAGGKEAHADLETNSQLGVSQSDIAGTKWTVWSRSTAGTLVARREGSSGDDRWFDYGLPAAGVQCSARGVSATGYVSGGHVIERAYCAGSTFMGSIYEFTLDNGAPQGWRNLNVAGYLGQKYEIAATSIVIGGHWTLFVLFTAGFDDLFVWWQDVTVPGTGFVAQIGAVNPYSTTSQLAVSRAPGATPATFHLFAAQVGGTVDVWRRDPGAWTNWNIGRPAAGINAMGTAAAAQDQIVAGSSYRVLLFCTARVQSDKLYLAWADNAGANAAFNWASYTLPAGNGNFQNSGYAIAATPRSDGVNRAIDAVALATQGVYSPQRIWRIRYSSLGFSGLLDIGADGESGTRTGGLGAYPRTGRSAVAFLGAGSDGNADRLYLKDGTDTTPGNPWNWANHGDGEPRSTLTAGPLGETSAAFFDGRAIVAGINHPGSGGPLDFSHVKTLWSSTDGDTWAAAWVEPPNTFGVSSDPTVDFDEYGTAYVSMQAVNIGADCLHGDAAFRTGDAILLYSTDDGTYPNPPMRVDPVEVPEHALDHPFMEVYRDLAGNGDRLHVAWLDTHDSEIFYTSMPIGGALDVPHPIYHTAGGGAPYLTVGAQGAVYVTWGSALCRINDTFTDCEHVPQQFSSTLAPSGELPALNDGTSDKFKPGNFALVASTSDPDIVYWAFLRKEADVDMPPTTELDVFISTGHYYEGLNPPFDWSPPVHVGDWQDDDADQFGPSIAVSQKARFMEPIVSVMWHERHGGNCDGFANRCYRVRRATSLTNGLTFLATQAIPIDTADSWSDPAELPISCLGDLNPGRDEHFLGHYRNVRGDLLHGRHVIVGSPNGGANPEAVLGSGWISGGYYNW